MKLAASVVITRLRYRVCRAVRGHFLRWLARHSYYKVTGALPVSSWDGGPGYGIPEVFRFTEHGLEIQFSPLRYTGKSADRYFIRWPESDYRFDCDMAGHPPFRHGDVVIITHNLQFTV